MAERRQRLLLIHTGGTFGMRTESESERVVPSSNGYLTELLNRVPELEKLADLQLQVLCNIDSSDMTPATWVKLCETIVGEWERFDAFVIIHGTDTMAYTASALSFFMSGLTKSIVLTGSQRPLSELRSDARSNLIDAVELATVGIPEVMICFDSQVHRGTRATKYSSEHLQAFRANNQALLGTFGVHFNVNRLLAAAPFPTSLRAAPQVDTRLSSDIVVLDCVPGMSLPSDLIEALVASAKGLVLKGFGSGNLPVASSDWLRLCERAQEQAIPVVMASQCHSGTVSLDAYANGRAFAERGVISGGDMSFESLVVKLMVMLGRGVPFSKRQEFFLAPLAEECRACLEY
jgi:L-asparaginase